MNAQNLQVCEILHVQNVPKTRFGTICKVLHVSHREIMCGKNETHKATKRHNCGMWVAKMRPTTATKTPFRGLWRVAFVARGFCGSKRQPAEFRKTGETT